MAKKKLEDARREIARLVECKSDDIVFASGATEANALAILGLAKAGAHFLYLPSAHASIVENMKLASERGVIIEPLPIKEGRVDIEKLKEMLRPETRLVSLEAVCGETGTIWNTHEVKGAIGNIYLHVDASQAVFTEKLSRSHYGSDLLTLDGGKLGAPGTGALIAHRTIPLLPLYGGGGQERGLRSGTEHVAAIEKFAQALSHAAQGREGFKARAAKLRAQLLSALASIPRLFINESREQAPHIVNISLLGRDTDYVVALLDEAGFAVSTRSACEADSPEGSRAVFALYGDRGRAASTLRISFPASIRAADMRRFGAALAQAVSFIDSTSSGAHH